jgi:hypothetical protein
MPVRPNRAVALAAALALVAGTAAPAAAQLELHLDAEVDVASAYAHRGVLLTNVPVVRPALGIGIPAGAGRATVGVGATVQPVAFADSGYFSMAGQAKSPNVAELRPSLSLSQPFGAFDFGFVASYRMFPNGFGITKAANFGTVESRVSLRRRTSDLSVAAGYDIGAVTGPFVEAALRQELPLAAGAALAFGSRLGWAIDQKVHGAPAAFAAFGRSGLSHIDFDLGARITAATVEVRPYVSLTHVPDPFEVAPVDGVPPAPAVQERWMVRVGTSVAVRAILPPGKKGK